MSKGVPQYACEQLHKVAKDQVSQARFVAAGVGQLIEDLDLVMKAFNEQKDLADELTKACEGMIEAVSTLLAEVELDPGYNPLRQAVGRAVTAVIRYRGFKI